MDDSNKILSFENFQAKFSELKCNYLEYQGIVSVINHSKCFLEFREKYVINYILKQNKVSITAYPLHCQTVYRNSSQMHTGMASHLPNPRQNIPMATHIQLGFQNDLPHKAFQFKFLHRIIYTNSRPFKIKLVDSPICSFCHDTEKTLIYFVSVQ